MVHWPVARDGIGGLICSAGVVGDYFCMRKHRAFGNLPLIEIRRATNYYALLSIPGRASASG